MVCPQGPDGRRRRRKKKRSLRGRLFPPPPRAQQPKCFAVNKRVRPVLNEIGPSVSCLFLLASPFAGRTQLLFTFLSALNLYCTWVVSVLFISGGFSDRGLPVTPHRSTCLSGDLHILLIVVIYMFFPATMSRVLGTRST